GVPGADRKQPPVVPAPPTNRGCGRGATTAEPEPQFSPGRTARPRRRPSPTSARPAPRWMVTKCSTGDVLGQRWLPAPLYLDPVAARRLHEDPQTPRPMQVARHQLPGDVVACFWPGTKGPQLAGPRTQDRG